MKFYPQHKPSTCHLIAIKTLLSDYSVFPNLKKIKKSLPKHSYGNMITEIGEMLAKEYHFAPTLITNNKIENLSKDMKKSLSNFKQKFTVLDREPLKKDLNYGPVMINVDWYKIKKKEEGQGGHYVVINKEDDNIMLYDGSNYKSKKATTFEFMKKASTDINRFHEDGMWMYVTKSS